MHTLKDEVLNEIIIGYRKIISERYEYKSLKKKYRFPNTINEGVVNEIKDYFLEYIYPNLERRSELDEAFEILENYIKSPQKLISILKSSIKLVFMHGKYLGKILNAGLQAMHSFKSATRFENSLVDTAIEKGIVPPYNTSKINSLICFLSRKEIDDFIENTEELFEIMYNKILVKKIKEVIGFLIAEMKAQPKLFLPKEIKGLEIGLEMITKGEKMLDKLTKEDQKVLIQFIVKIENDNLDELFT